MVTVRYVGEGKEKTIASSGEVLGDILRELGHTYETAVVTRDGVIITEDECIDEHDEIMIIPVVSGG